MALGECGLTLVEAVLAVVAFIFFCILVAKSNFNRKQADAFREMAVVIGQDLKDCRLESDNLKILLNHGRKAE